MKVEKKFTHSVYYITKRIIHEWVRVAKITFVLLLTLGFLTLPVSVAYGEPHRVSRTLTTSIHVLPKSDLAIEAAKTEKAWNSLDTEKFLNDLASKESAEVTKVIRDGKETVLITKVFE